MALPLTVQTISFNNIDKYICRAGPQLGRGARRDDLGMFTTQSRRRLVPDAHVLGDRLRPEQQKVLAVLHTRHQQGPLGQEPVLLRRLRFIIDRIESIKSFVESIESLKH